MSQSVRYAVAAALVGREFASLNSIERYIFACSVEQYLLCCNSKGDIVWTEARLAKAG
jgi:hypothetical protein